MNTSKILLFLSVFTLVISTIFLLPETEKTSQNAFSGDKTQNNDEKSHFKKLLARGFPEDYASALASLLEKHPLWQFEPLFVTRQNKNYTLEYVVDAEMSISSRNLVPAAEKYASLRSESDLRLYDSGWYAASREAVEYYIDPKNFFTEVQIFQFYDLKYTENALFSKSDIEKILHGTFMENSFSECNNDFAEAFLEAGKEIGINPLFLAVRARQEQGKNGNPLAHGTCGEQLFTYYSESKQVDGDKAVFAPSNGFSEQKLRTYDGLFNIFNIGASGNGYFYVLLNGCLRAQAGSPSFENLWGSPEWNTVEKSILGGAEILAKNYIDNYQNTPYLQKWNVDFRSKDQNGGCANFWKQYMQNIFAPQSEAEKLFSIFNDAELLDTELKFVIPIYE